MVEPQSTAVFLTILGVLIAASMLFSRQVDRLGVPVVLLFLVLGMLGGSEGIGRIEFSDYGIAVRVGTIYLVLILFNGGLSTAWGSVRGVLLPAGLLASVGVVITAALVAIFCRMLGLPLIHSLLVGAVVSSTDAAAVLAVLRGSKLRLRPRVGNTLEVESCINDPMAVILTVTIIEAAQSTGTLDWTFWLGVPLQLVVGTAFGLAFGYAGLTVLRRVRPSTVGLYPAMTLGLAFLSYGVATLLHGSGFLSVYVTALYLGNSNLPYRAGLSRIHESLGWLSQISLFLMLGLLVYPLSLLRVMHVGLAVGLFLAFVARPVAVLLCLLPLRFPPREILYLGWIGLRGAVPIMLGAFPMLAGVPGAGDVFNIVFFVVVLSTILPGATIREVTRWMGMAAPEKPRPSAVLELHSAFPLHGEIASYLIEPQAAVCGLPLSEIHLPPQAAVALIVRGKELVAARGQTVLEQGDHAYVFFRPEDRRFIELLFGRAETG